MAKGNKILNMDNTKIISRADVKALGRIARQREGIKTPTVSRLAARNAFDKHFENHEEDKLQIIESRQVSHWIKGYCNVGIPTQE